MVAVVVGHDAPCGNPGRYDQEVEEKETEIAGLRGTYDEEKKVCTRRVPAMLHMRATYGKERRETPPTPHHHHHHPPHPPTHPSSSGRDLR